MAKGKMVVGVVTKLDSEDVPDGAIDLMIEGIIQRAIDDYKYALEMKDK